MDRKMMWIYMDRLMVAQPSQTSTIPRWDYSVDIDTPKQHRAYLELCHLGFVEIFMMPDHPWLQAAPTIRGMIWGRAEQKNQQARNRHRKAYWIRRMRRYVFGFNSHECGQFERRHALYLTNANERQAARNLAGMDMIRAVEVYEDNPMFDPLYKREHTKAYRDTYGLSISTEIKVTHGTLIRHLRDLKGSRLP